jgi:two-component system sensor histidine kinase PilS (NtrC family)
MKGKGKIKDRPADELAGLRLRVTELEARELERRKALEALEESERRFRSVFENVASGILMTGPDGRVLMANNPARQFLGLDEDDIGCDLKAKIPQGGKLLSWPIVGGRHRLEINAADGERRLIGFTNEPVTLPEGKGLITLFQDISQIHKAEERRRRAEQLAYVGDMAARLSHDIKNPLAAVRTGLKVISRQAGLASKDSDVLDRVIKEVENITAMVSGLLNAARYEKLQPEFVNMAPVLDDTCEIFQSMAKGKGKNFRLTTPNADLTVLLDRKAFGRALGNLIHNAIDAVGKGGSITVEGVEVERYEAEKLFPGFNGGVGCVRVVDDGPGIPFEIQKMIFNPFFTTRESGTGLGLAVAHDIVDYHGGLLRVKSSPGQGACFEMFLPLGERLPCWEWVVYHEWEIYYGEDRCQSCEVKDSGTGYLCWAVKISEDEMERDLFPDKCLRCPVFLSGNLAHYYRPGD